MAFLVVRRIVNLFLVTVVSVLCFAMENTVAKLLSPVIHKGIGCVVLL